MGTVRHCEDETKAWSSGRTVPAAHGDAGATRSEGGHWSASRAAWASSLLSHSVEILPLS